MPLVSPTPKPLPKSKGKDKTTPLNIKTSLWNIPKCPLLKTQEAAQVVSDALSQKQVLMRLTLITNHV